MTDTLTRSQRSRLMARITGDNLRPETMLREQLALLRVRFDANVRCLPGSPDIVLRPWRLAVFVHGCWWHGCLKHYRLPKSRRSFWSRKLATNRRRDSLACARLRRAGWRTMVVWEHEIRKDAKRAAGRVMRRARRG